MGKPLVFIKISSFRNGRSGELREVKHLST